MKKRVVIIIALISALVLAACGASGAASSGAVPSEAKAAPAYAEEAAEEAEYDTAFYEEDYAAGNGYSAESAPASSKEASTAPRAYNGDVKLIYRADISAETTDIEKAAAEIEALAGSLGGYIEYSDISSNSGRTDSYRFASYTVRVPGEKYEAFLTGISSNGACKVTYLSKSTTDIGAEYADSEARLKTYRIKQERLQELLKEAETVEDIISIENALTDVEYEIEYYSGNLNRYDSLISFSTVTIGLTQVARETEVVEGGSLGERIARSFKNGLSNFATGFENFLVGLAGALLPLIICAVIVIVIVLIVRRAVRGSSGKKKDRMTDEEDE